MSVGVGRCRSVSVGVGRCVCVCRVAISMPCLSGHALAPRRSGAGAGHRSLRRPHKAVSPQRSQQPTALAVPLPQAGPLRTWQCIWLSVQCGSIPVATVLGAQQFWNNIPGIRMLSRIMDFKGTVNELTREVK